jgi:hypothetical protein
MRVRLASVLALSVPVAVAVVLACGADTYDNECGSLGGACVTDEAQCGGTLPFACAIGVCCVPNGAAATGDASYPAASTGDAGLPVTIIVPGGPSHDATITPDVSTATPDANVTGDSALPPADAPGEAEVADQSAPVDAGHDTSTPIPDAAGGHDAETHDGSTPDAAVDGHKADAGTTADAGEACPGYAAPTDTAGCLACLTGVHTCQANGCFGGYYCKTSTLACVRPSSVPCDAGM